MFFLKANWAVKYTILLFCLFVQSESAHHVTCKCQLRYSPDCVFGLQLQENPWRQMWGRANTRPPRDRPQAEVCEQPDGLRATGQYLNTLRLVICALAAAHLCLCNYCSHCSLLLFIQKSSSSKSVPIVITVIIILLMSIAAGVIFVKKYVCGGRLVCISTQMWNVCLNVIRGNVKCNPNLLTAEHGLLSLSRSVWCDKLVFLGFPHRFPWLGNTLNALCRFLVHRYSVLQQHAADDSAVDGMDDPLETNHSQNGKIVFHDESDEVQCLSFTSSYRQQHWNMGRLN